MSVDFSHVGILDGLPSRIIINNGSTTVKNLLQFLEQKYDYQMDGTIIIDGKLNEQLLLLVNGISTIQTGGLDTVIPNGSKVVLMGMIYGG